MLASEKLSICIVDDEKEVAEGFAAALADQFEVKSYLSAVDALKAFEEGFAPSIVVSDLQMPEMNGLTFIQKMKEDGLASKVIVSSGYADKNAAVRAINLGVDGFLEKPFTVRQFKEMIIKTSQVDSAVRELVYDLYQLNELYFERAARAENALHNLGVNYPEDLESKKEFLKGVKDEHELSVKIDNSLKRLFNDGR